MRSRHMATVSLAVMAAGFIVTLFLPQTYLVELLKGGFEAGLVGGIADWFAVTALFRHPLGIPIPHTSLLLRNKDRIIQSLVSAMENELLNKRSIEEKLRKLNLFRVIASLLARQMARKQVRKGIADTLIPVVRELPLDKLVPMLQSGLAAYVGKADLKSMAESGLTRLMHKQYDEKALDYVLQEASRWVVRTETRIMLGKIAGSKLSEVKMGGFMGFAVQAFAGFMDEDQLGGILQNMLISGLRDLQKADNPYRGQIMQEVRIRLFQWVDDEQHMASLQAWLGEAASGEAAREFLTARLEDLRALAIGKLETEQANGGRGIFRLYRRAVRYLDTRQDWLDRMEARLLTALIGLVESNHYRIGQLVRENLNRMDDSALVSMLEDKVGKDLQWIRVNGALCGFVIGIVLSVIQLI